MSRTAEDLEKILREGATRIAARAAENRALDAAEIVPRLHATVEKYVLRDAPDALARDIDSFMDSLRADDFLLVIACERGDEMAWNDLLSQFQSTVRSAARSASAGEAEAEELAQSVWAELYGLRARRSDGKASGKLAYYSGCGSLGGWLRAVVGQLATDRYRRTSRLVQPEEAADFDYLARERSHVADAFMPANAADPESALAEKETTQGVQSALAEVVSNLNAEDRLLIKLYYFDGLRLREAGAVLGAHEATMSRRLTRLHKELREGVEKILIKERGWTKAETARAFAEAAGGMETDIGRALAGEAVATVEHGGKGEQTSA